MTTLNRRTMLAALTASAVPSSAIAAELAPSTLAPLLDAYRAAEAIALDAEAIANRITADLGPDLIEATWTIPGNMRTHDLGLWDDGPRSFFNAASANKFFDRQIAKVEPRLKASLLSGDLRAAVARDRADIETLRGMALAVLEPKDAAIRASGWHAAGDAAEAACMVAMDALAAVLKAPCVTMADVRAKAALLLDASPDYFAAGEQSADDVRALLRSFLPA